MKRLMVGVALLSSLALHAVAQAEPECRGATPVETAVVAKAGAVIKAELVDVWSADPWQGNVDSSIINGGVLNVATHPGPYRPLMLCSDLVRLTLDYATHDDYANGLRQKQSDLITQAGDMAAQMTTPDAAAQAKMQAMMGEAADAVAPLHAEVTILENDPYLSEAAPGQACAVIAVTGADFAYRCTGHDDNGAPLTESYIKIGRWAGAKAGGGYVPYPFAHKTAGPWIETISVRIAAPAGLADSMIAKVDWQKLHEGLTP